MDTPTYFYSPASGGFYLQGLHETIPEDAVALSADAYAALLDGHSKGMDIVPDGNGHPALHAPDLPPASEPAPIISNLAFDLRFTQAERVAIELASLDDPAAPLPQRTAAATLRVNLGRAAKAQFTDLSDPVTRDGVEQMEALGLLAQGRAAEILDTPVQPGERPGSIPRTSTAPSSEEPPMP